MGSILNLFDKTKGMAKKIIFVDIIIILSFALFAGMYHANRVAGNRASLLYSTDVASVASFAAAADHPDLFVEDEVLDNQDNFKFYATIHLPLVRFFYKFTKDYALASTSLLSLHIFMQMFGFYLLGFILFRNRFWAILLTMLTSVNVPLAVSEFWGVFPDILSRMSFHAVFPYLLLAIFRWRSKPFAWGWLMLVAGICMHLHPPSALCWGFSLWLGLWACHPKDWRMSVRIRKMLFLGLAFLLGALVFSLNYLANRAGSTVLDYAVWLEIMHHRFPTESLDVMVALRKFITNMTFYRIAIFGIIGGIFVWCWQEKVRKRIVIILMWIIGILLTSLFIPFIEQTISRIYQIPPLEIEMVRNLKYIFPLMLIFCLWPFVAMVESSSNKRRKIAIYIIGFFLVFGWSSRQAYKHIMFLKENGYFMAQQDKEKSETLDMLEAVKRLTPVGARMLPLYSTHSLALRYYALRPIVYVFKDGATFAYVDHQKLQEWYGKAKQANDVFEIFFSDNDDDYKMDRARDFAREVNAEYAVIDRNYFSKDFAFKGYVDLLYLNNRYVVIKI